jgi:uncharacterized secreted repeat protein (TIGR03808 family)
MVTRRSLGLAAGLAVTPATADTLLEPGESPDQTELLQKRLDAGGPIILAPGVFKVKKLRATKPFALIGTPGATQLESIGTLLEISAPRATLRDIDFATDDTKENLVTVDGTLVLEATDCIFRGGLNGLSLDRCGGRVSRNRFSGQAQTSLFSTDSRGLIISENDVDGAGNNGIQVWRREIGEDGSQVIGNRISNIRADGGGDGQNGNGINVFRAGNVTVANNRITDIRFSGIRDNAGSNAIITGNSISRAGEVALYVEFGFQGAIVSNNLIEDVVFGISITNFNDNGRLAVCSGNLIRNAHGGTSGKPRVGGAIFVEADTVVTSNVMEGINGYAIEMGWSDKLRNLVASHNIIRDAKVGIAVSTVNGVGTAMISENIFENTTPAIQGYDHETPSTGDLTEEGAQVPAHITMRGNTIIEKR